jgi:hypothetical protein
MGTIAAAYVLLGGKRGEFRQQGRNSCEPFNVIRHSSNVAYLMELFFV